MNKYHIITLILCLFCLGGAATASPDRTAAAPDTQARSSQLKVSGIIKDDAGSPLIGVTIVVKGTSSGSVSNSDGSYTITVPYAEATLMVSYIGYAPQEINVNNRTRIDITMVEDSKALEEVVVVGYNVQKKETITGQEMMAIIEGRDPETVDNYGATREEKQPLFRPSSPEVIEAPAKHIHIVSEPVPSPEEPQTPEEKSPEEAQPDRDPEESEQK